MTCHSVVLLIASFWDLSLAHIGACGSRDEHVGSCRSLQGVAVEKPLVLTAIKKVSSLYFLTVEHVAVAV